jgi:hypothetical protein
VPHVVTTRLLVDSHVHFHPCFTWDVFLDSAARNFSDARRERGVGPESPGCLLFTECAGANAFQSLRSTQRPIPARGWRIDNRDEPDSILLTHECGETVIIVAGRQIITAENLEVLSLGSTADFPDGQPIRAVLQSVMQHGAIAVIPWGFGKWWGQRGRIVRDLIMHGDLPFCVGDNGGRARWFPRPSLFRTADEHGIPVLAGSDSLPLLHHVTRSGSYGFVLEDWIETSRPASAIKDRLRALKYSPATFGRLSSTAAMMRSQLDLRWQRRRILPGTV